MSSLPTALRYLWQGSVGRDPSPKITRGASSAAADAARPSHPTAGPARDLRGWGLNPWETYME